MTATNDFLPFAIGGGANVESQASYAADSDRTNGNQPGVASSAFNNKALRQANFVASQVAQMASDITGASANDDGNTTEFLQTLKAALQALPPTVTLYTSGSGTHKPTYWFFIASGSATAAATYTNNAITFTVAATVASETLISMTGGGPPLAAGTLTKASGTGDATLTFYAVRAPLYLVVDMLGGGGGGTGSGTADGTTAGAGGDTTFGTRTAGGGTGSTARTSPGSGGSVSGSGYTTVLSFPGGAGTGAQIGPTTANGSQTAGGRGGESFCSGAGVGGGAGSGGGTGRTNTGGGGGGGGNDNNNANTSGSGGGAGAFFRGLIAGPFTSFSYAVGAAGTPGGSGASGRSGGTGAAGFIGVTEFYQ